jgi:HlyD family secretion protein
VKKRIVVLAVLAAAAAGAGLVWRHVGDGRGAPAGVLRLSGNIEATEVQLSFRLAGWVEERPVTEGQQLAKGQLVARLESRELEGLAAVARAEAEAVKAFLAQLEAGARPEEIAAAEAALARARADAAAAKADHERAVTLMKAGAITAQEFDARKAADGAAAAAVGQADAQLKLVRAGPRQEEIAQARAKLEGARQAAALAETRLGYAKLVSPLAGAVLSKATEPGEYVSAGTPIVTAADLSAVSLRAYVSETDLGRVKLGQPVRVTADTWPGRVYEGKVAFIAEEAEFTPKNIQTHAERVKLVYRVKIDIQNPTGELKPGMPADAEILTGEP